jgi:hypothetical protein
MYLQNYRLSYGVSVLLVNKGEFMEYHLVPVPIPVNKNKQIYIRPAESILCVDKTRQYYYFSSELQLQKMQGDHKKKVCVQTGKTPTAWPSAGRVGGAASTSVEGSTQ